MTKIALSALCKESADSIKEWIEYHSAIGVDHFILYDNGSYPKLTDVFSSEIKNGLVSIVDWTQDNQHGRQIRAQVHCVNNYDYFRWIGFFDIDEFVVLLDESVDIKTYLSKYENYDGVCLHWLLFGANNHINRQNSIIYNYTQSCPTHGANEHIKSIINPKGYDKTQGYHNNPHWMPTIKGSVNILGQVVQDAFGSTRQRQSKPIINEIMRLNHYYTKSLEDFQIKASRGGGNKVDRKYEDVHFKSMQKENVFNNDIILLYDRIKNNGNDN
jgi:hypothetical protein